ncbi:hypothetical protein Pla123a_25290 [Posidoniimonas polymericola]|uniref:PEP-CTERM protein-sorting domain-containing protein n=1 Tax=Posidoniimonas polymericola TaxID=2528002 RepID=A0A5C5YQH8_9BACT|nr:choice-of-anchor tandem repeat NxxGxxAF-containing protein [Posidoniimonas polymericola]TWT77099.1 hypothetical protein Pla123a_25290 [Posidoniimonas polymericola]
MLRCSILLLAACAAASWQPVRADSLRVLAVTGREIEGAGFEPINWIKGELSHDGGVWALAEGPTEPCGQFTCQIAPVQLLRFDATGAGLLSARIGERDKSLFGTGQIYQLATDSQGRYAAYSAGTPTTPTELWSVDRGPATPALVATSDEQLFIDNQFAREIGVGHSGEVYYSGQFQPSQATSTQQDTGIWRVRNGETDVIAREGSPAPAVPGALLGPIGSHSPLIIFGSNPSVATFSSSRGGVAFRAEIEIPGFEFVNERGLWVNRGQGTELVTRASLVAPGTENGNVFAPESSFSPFAVSQAFSEPLITDAGDVVFAANLRSGGNGWDGLWRSSVGGGLEAVVTVHDTVDDDARPDERAASYRDIDGFAAANAGHVAFTGEMRMESIAEDEFGYEYSVYEEQYGVWLSTPGAGLTLIEMTDNDTQASDATYLDPDLRVNSAGQVVFRSNYYGEETLRVLTATGRDGEVVQLLETGDTFDVSDNTTPDLRTVSDLSFADLDDAGRVLIQAWFEEGGSALIVSDAVAAPSIFGDYNGDGQTDAADYAVWQSTYGATVRVGDGADGNLNGVIDAGDYAYWRDRFAAAGAEGLALAAPEPAAIGLLCAAAGIGLWGRGRAFRG